MGNNDINSIANIANKIAPAPVLSLKSSLCDIINISHLSNRGKTYSRIAAKLTTKKIDVNSIG